MYLNILEVGGIHCADEMFIHNFFWSCNLLFLDPGNVVAVMARITQPFKHEIC